MITVQRLTVPILIFILTFTAPNMASAASIEITPAVQASLDKTTAAADRNKAAQITRLYYDFITLNNQNRINEEEIKFLHDSNEQFQLLLNKQIKKIDADKINRLDDQVKQGGTLTSHCSHPIPPSINKSAWLRMIRNKTLISSSSSASKKALSSVWKTFTKSVSKVNPSGTADALSGTISLYREIVDQKQKIINLEKKVNDLIVKAKEQIPVE